MKLQVLKKGGQLQDWNATKVIAAAKKSAQSVGFEFTDTSLKALEDSILGVAQVHADNGIIPVAKMHILVVKVLETIDHDVAMAYQNYRNYKSEWAQSWEEVTKGTDRILDIGDRENANFDSTMTSTKSSLMRGELTKEIYKQRFLTPVQRSAIDDGFIYIHDIRDLIFNSINCCLFDMATVLNGGFTMGNLKYKEPRSALTALQVIGDIMLTATGQQFGGFTVPDIDKVMIRYVKKSRKELTAKAKKWGIQNVEDFVSSSIHEELRQGFQSIEHKLNNVPSGRGDFAFTTFSFGNVDLQDEDGYMYALYGTPAESLCGTQVRQFKAKYGVIEGVSDREYFSNSFHMHVTADITPMQKQDLEHDLFHMVLGGHIQYVRLINTRNLEAIVNIVLRAMKLGFYAGFNFNLVICEDCGFRPAPAHDDHDIECCPHCHSHNIMMINRLCGYIGYGKRNGESRFNDSKLAEVGERKSM